MALCSLILSLCYKVLFRYSHEGWQRRGKCWGISIHEANYLGESAGVSADPDMTLIPLWVFCLQTTQLPIKSTKVYWEPALSQDLQGAQIKMLKHYQVKTWLWSLPAVSTIPKSKVRTSSRVRDTLWFLVLVCLQNGVLTLSVNRISLMLLPQFLGVWSRSVFVQ